MTEAARLATPSRPMLPAPRLTVDLGAIAANYRVIQRQIGRAEIAPAIKADAYGLGADAVAAALWNAGARIFFVAHPSEGVALRRAVPQAIIYVLHGIMPGAARAFHDAQLRPVLFSLAEVAAYRGLNLKEPPALLFDTGMTRLGFGRAEGESLIANRPLIAALRPALVMSHLACGDEPEHPNNALQRQRFEEICQHFQGIPRSLGATGGALIGHDFALDLVRPGIGLYGGAPHGEGPNPFAPVVHLAAPILQVHTIDSGESVGYGATYRAAGPRRIAVAGMGYADGLARVLSNRGRAMIAGRMCSFAGRVSMDLVALDASAVPEGELKTGAVAEFLNAELTIDAMAQAADTAPYEILTRMGPRVERVYGRWGDLA